MVARGLTFHRHPILAQIVPIRRCNLSCTYCNEFDAHSQPVPTVDMLARIDRLAALGTTIIDLSGGEPLLHPELDEIIRRIRTHGLLAGLLTNGYLLSEGRITRLNRAGLDHFQISIDNVSPDDTSKKSLRLLDPKLQLLARHAQFAVNINSVLGGNLQHPQDALTIARRAIELGLTATVGLIHETGGQLIPLTPDRQQVYEEIQRLTARSIQRRTRTRSNATSRGACRTTGTAAPSHGTSTFARMPRALVLAAAGLPGNPVGRVQPGASRARIPYEQVLRAAVHRLVRPSRRRARPFARTAIGNDRRAAPQRRRIRQARADERERAQVDVRDEPPAGSLPRRGGAGTPGQVTRQEPRTSWRSPSASAFPMNR